MTEIKTPSEVTNKVERSHGGMPSWAILGIGRNHEGKIRIYWPYKSEIDGERFLTRFILFRTKYAGCEITRIHMDDTSRPFPHDHSRTFLSGKLWGTYTEWVYYDPQDLSKKKLIAHRRFGLHRLRHTEAHSIMWVSPRLVTVLFTGPQRQASNYWTPSGLQSIGMGVDQNPKATEWA